jgi:predicted dienelactone hydrolase
MLLSFSASAQTFNIGHRHLKIVDSSRDNRWVTTEIYYPADTAGDDVAATKSNEPTFPLIVFGHGFIMKWTAYRYLWEALVKNGYIVAFPLDEGSFDANHAELSKDMVFLVHWIQKQNHAKIAFLQGRVAATSCVMGHSMGGGAAVLAAAQDTSVTALVTLAMAETHPSAIKAAKHIRQPALFFSGSHDCITKPAHDQIPAYDSLRGKCNLYVNILGGSHCYMAESNFACGLGEATCGPKPSISRERQHEIVLKYLVPWLDLQLKNKQGNSATLFRMLSADKEIESASNCYWAHP